jgi:hypothetical protein
MQQPGDAARDDEPPRDACGGSVVSGGHCVTFAEWLQSHQRWSIKAWSRDRRAGLYRNVSFAEHLKRFREAGYGSYEMSLRESWTEFERDATSH